MEIFDVYDRDGNKTGKTVRRGIDKLLDGEYHLVTNVIFVNSQNGILVQKRSAEKKEYPNFWGMTGGAVVSGENSREGCIRETEEEIGIVPDLDKAVIIKYQNGHTMVDGYIIRQNFNIEDLVLQKSEVAKVEWLSIDEVRKIIAEDKMVAKTVEGVEICLDMIEKGQI